MDNIDLFLPSERINSAQARQVANQKQFIVQKVTTYYNLQNGYWPSKSYTKKIKVDYRIVLTISQHAPDCDASILQKISTSSVIGLKDLVRASASMSSVD